MAAVIGVSVKPGATALTRTPCPACVAAALRTSASTPPLAAAIASWLATPMRATTELTNTAAPASPFSSASQACSTNTALSRFTRISSR